MKYSVIERSAKEDLEADVNSAIANGARLVGGVSVSVYIEHLGEGKFTDEHTYTTYAQAVTFGPHPYE